MTDLTADIAGTIDDETRLLSAIAYGEASTADNTNEISGVSHAVVNRAHAWGKKVSEMIKADPGYTYAADGTNARFNLLKASTLTTINKNKGMKIAVNSAKEAIAGEGDDPSNGAYWWDGPDLKLLRASNSRIKWGFRYGDPSHNIYNMNEILKPVILYWRVKNKRTGAIENSKERGRFNSGYVSTAALGETIFWLYNPDYISTTGCKKYR